MKLEQEVKELSLHEVNLHKLLFEDGEITLHRKGKVHTLNKVTVTDSKFEFNHNSGLVVPVYIVQGEILDEDKSKLLGTIHPFLSSSGVPLRDHKPQFHFKIYSPGRYFEGKSIFFEPCYMVARVVRRRENQDVRVEPFRIRSMPNNAEIIHFNSKF